MDSENTTKPRRGLNAATLTPEQVVEIRGFLQEAEDLKDRLALLTYKSLGNLYGVAPQTIYAIKHYHSWQDL